MSNCTQACMCSGWCFWTYFTAIANAIGASFVVGSFDHVPSFSGGETPIALFVLFDHVITLAVDLRDTTVAFESDSFLEVLSWSLFERAKRTAVPCSIFRKVLLSKRMSKRADVSSSLIARLREYNKTTMQWP